MQRRTAMSKIIAIMTAAAIGSVVLSDPTVTSAAAKQSVYDIKNAECKRQAKAKIAGLLSRGRVRQPLHPAQSPDQSMHRALDAALIRAAHRARFRLSIRHNAPHSDVGMECL